MLTLLAASLTVGIHLASVHVPAEQWHQNVNPGVYVMSDDGYTIGAYRNSLDRPSVYAGKAFSYGPFSILLGAVSGYQRKDYKANLCLDGTTSGSCYAGYSRGAIGPMVAPSVLIFDHLRLTYLPGIHTSSAIHLSIETKL